MGVPPRRILSPTSDRPNPHEGKGLRLATPDMTAQGQRAARISSPDLAEVLDAWDDLPEPIRAGILAMIRSASGKGRGKRR
jgi:hypothetical protein